jgi:hypothetical protein
MVQHISATQESSRAAIEPLAVGENGISAFFGGERVSSVTLWRWSKAGLIERVPGTRRKLWTVESIKRMVAGKGGRAA